MAYVKKIWKDYPDTTTPILASDMNNIENGLSAVDTAVALKVNTADIVNTLVSTSTTVPLSANMGKTLAEGTLKSKRILFTRDGQGANGDVSYTGVGFKPTSIVALMAVPGTAYCSEGAVDSAKDSLCKYNRGNGVMYIGGNLIMYSDQASFAQGAIVKSYDNDGFTLTWTKAGTPTANTMTCYLICYK